MSISGFGAFGEVFGVAHSLLKRARESGGNPASEIADKELEERHGKL